MKILDIDTAVALGEVYARENIRLKPRDLIDLYVEEGYTHYKRASWPYSVIKIEDMSTAMRGIIRRLIKEGILGKRGTSGYMYDSLV